jgi:pyruvate dehydrogenase E2 component (dihydrolipoamide acetyltransferase)
MATRVIMPALELTQETGRLISWLKHEGDPVSKDEPLMEIETDKATIEIAAPESGVLGGLLIKEDDIVPVGQTIAWILAPGEEVPATTGNEPISGRSKNIQSQPDPNIQQDKKTVIPNVSPVARKMAEELGINLSEIKPKGKKIEKADVVAFSQSATIPVIPEKPSTLQTKHVIPASPKARRLATERGYDLSDLTGTGPQGSIVAADIPMDVKAGDEAPVTFETIGNIWRVMTERMVSSWKNVPHFYLVREVDASELLEWRSRLSPKIEQHSGVKPTITDFLVKMVAFCLKEHPRLNASWVDGKIQNNPNINIGIAVAIEDGLTVPVIHAADQASLGNIATRSSDLISRAKEHKLALSELTGGTFTITNLGMYKVDAFDAIVNPPQAAILAVGQIADRVVPRNGQVVIRPQMILTVSLDHRVVDGARAAQFLDSLADVIENPWSLLRDLF